MVTEQRLAGSCSTRPDCAEHQRAVPAPPGERQAGQAIGCSFGRRSRTHCRTHFRARPWAALHLPWSNRRSGRLPIRYNPLLPSCVVSGGGDHRVSGRAGCPPSPGGPAASDRAGRGGRGGALDGREEGDEPGRVVEPVARGRAAHAGRAEGRDGGSDPAPGAATPDLLAHRQADRGRTPQLSLPGPPDPCPVDQAGSTSGV